MQENTIMWLFHLTCQVSTVVTIHLLDLTIITVDCTFESVISRLVCHGRF